MNPISPLFALPAVLLLSPLTASFATSEASYLNGAPLGQKACYDVSLDRTRTSFAIREGDADVTIKSPASASTESFDAVFRARMDLLFFGEDSLTFAIEILDEYFAQGFWQLFTSADPVYEAPEYKMEYSGSSTITVNGRAYENAHRVRIFDIDTSRAAELVRFMNQLADAEALRLGAPLEDAQAIQNLEIHAYVHESIPALGALTLDMTGKRHGFSLKVGMDYSADPGACVPRSPQDDGGRWSP